MKSAAMNQWLQTLSGAIGQRLEMNDEGLLALELQSGLVCTIEVDATAEVVSFHSDLMSFDPEQASDLNEYAMEKNVYNLGSYGLTLGIDNTRGFLVASTSVPESLLTEESFLILFERFVSAVEENHRDFQRFSAG